jgi:hypothetical protein
MRNLLRGSVAAVPAALVASHAFATDPLAAMVTGVSFTDLQTDVVTVGVAIAGLFIVYAGVKWIIKMIRHA